MLLTAVLDIIEIGTEAFQKQKETDNSGIETYLRKTNSHCPNNASLNYLENEKTNKSHQKQRDWHSLKQSIIKIIKNNRGTQLSASLRQLAVLLVDMWAIKEKTTFPMYIFLKLAKVEWRWNFVLLTWWSFQIS